MRDGPLDRPGPPSQRKAPHLRSPQADAEMVVYKLNNHLEINNILIKNSYKLKRSNFTETEREMKKTSRDKPTNPMNEEEV